MFRRKVVEHPDFNFLVKLLVLERPKDEVRVAVMEVVAEQVLVQFRWPNLKEKDISIPDCG